jgi:putative ABC transport system permease protein
MQTFRIALKNISRQWRRSLLLGGAIAFGFFIFVLVSGFTGGLLKTVSNSFANSSGGHIYVSGTEVSPQGSEIKVIADGKLLTETLDSLGDDLLSYNTRSSIRSSLIFTSSEEVISLTGIDPIKEPTLLPNLNLKDSNLERFLNTPNALLLPEETILKLGATVGESIIVKARTVTGQQNVLDAVIAGSFEGTSTTGPDPGGSSGYAHLSMVNQLLDLTPLQYQTLNIYLQDTSKLVPITASFHQALSQVALVEPREEVGGFRPPDFNAAFEQGLSSIDESERWEGTKFTIENLNDRMENATTLITLMQNLSLGIFVIILGIIMVGVMNSYRMVMIERTAEIGTMRAMGVQKAGIRAIFIWEAFFIALGGALVGLVLAFLVMIGLGLINFGISSTFSFFLNQGYLQFSVTGGEIFRNILLICLMSIAAVLIPARAAANLKPAEALRASY